MGWISGSKAIAMRVFTPVCTRAICLVIPVGIPSETIIPANQIVQVVPIFAPSTAAIADGKGKAPDATRPISAVVDNDEDCQRRVHPIAPKNI